MAKSKKDFTLLLIALFCSSLAHAQKQVPAERKDSTATLAKHHLTARPDMQLLFRNKGRIGDSQPFKKMQLLNQHYC